MSTPPATTSVPADVATMSPMDVQAYVAKLNNDLIVATAAAAKANTDAAAAKTLADKGNKRLYVLFFLAICPLTGSRRTDQTDGRGINKAVSLFRDVQELSAEADRRYNDQENDSVTPLQNGETEQEYVDAY